MSALFAGVLRQRLLSCLQTSADCRGGCWRDSIDAAGDNYSHGRAKRSLASVGAGTWGVVNAATLRSQNEKFREDWEAEKLAMDREVEGVDGVPLMQLVSRAAHLAVLPAPPR
ncbi:hypothetical protein T484DRAFT_1811577 [Baffinella frigidus]|nr:hypothetical protein T484DRAFT_1811577 [Cryptophyta sp. CCMP2293]